MSNTPFRAPITERMAWRSADIKNKAQLSQRLAPAHLDELDGFVARVRGKPVEQIVRDDIDSPRLRTFMDGARAEVLNGYGMVIITGCDFDRYSRDDFERISWALGLYLGNPVSQSVFGERIAHVRHAAHNPSGRGYRTTRELTAHTDTPDALGLMCIQTAKQGGLSTAVSALSIHNEILARHPEHLEPLYRGYPFFRLGQELPGQEPISPYNVPVFCNIDGVVSCMYVPHLLRAAARERGVEMPADLAAAMEYVDQLAVRPEFALSYAFERGDIFFINNRTLMHSRTEYVDHDAPELKRDLLRLWVDMPQGQRPIVAEMDPYQQPGSGGRGGVMYQPEKANANKAAA